MEDYPYNLLIAARGTKMLEILAYYYQGTELTDAASVMQ